MIHAAEMYIPAENFVVPYEEVGMGFHENDGVLQQHNTQLAQHLKETFPSNIWLGNFLMSLFHLLYPRKYLLLKVVIWNHDRTWQIE